MNYVIIPTNDRLSFNYLYLKNSINLTSYKQEFKIPDPRS